MTAFAVFVLVVMLFFGIDHLGAKLTDIAKAIERRR
jgi:hypothetical protein